MPADYNPRIHLKSKWIPRDFQISREFSKRFFNFRHGLRSLFVKRRSGTGLLRHQTHLLKSLQRSNTFVVCKADKNLGPCILEKDIYIHRALDDHLRDQQTYCKLTKAKAGNQAYTTTKMIDQLINRHKKHIPSNELRFLRNATKSVTDPYSKFYLTFKVHKSPWKTRGR